MADKIKLRAGSKAKIPTLAEREIGYCTDENALYVGTEDGNKKVGGDGVTEQDKQDIIDGVIEGIQGGYGDNFWEVYQNQGNRRDYRYAFFDVCWTDEIYNPKYPIIASGVSTDMFGLTSITDTLVTIDFSENTTTNVQVFRNSYNLKTIRELIVHEGIVFTNWFSNATAL